MTYKPTLRRKLAIASWDAPKAGSIYGKLPLDMTNVLAYLKEKRQITGTHITITHFIGKLISKILIEEQSLNGQIRFGRFVPHKGVSVSFLIHMAEKNNLGFIKIENAHEKSLADISTELKNRSLKLCKGKDEDFNKNMSLVKLLPSFLIKPILNFTGYLASVLGIEAKFLGLRAFPFGSCIITNVGMFGLDEAYVPPTPFAHVPLYLMLPEIKDHVVAEEDKIIIKPYLNLTATLDHRFVDGFQGAKLASMTKKFFQNPETLEPL